MTDESDIGIPKPGTSAQEIMVRPTFGFLLEGLGMPCLTRSFDLDGDDSTGFPEASACARAMHHALDVAGHPCAILIQLWTYTAHGDKVRWQVEFKGQDNLGDALHVQAMREWVESGAPLSFVARLTGNPLESVRAIVKPSVDLGRWQDKPRIVQRIGDAW